MTRFVAVAAAASNRRSSCRKSSKVLPMWVFFMVQSDRNWASLRFAVRRSAGGAEEHDLQNRLPSVVPVTGWCHTESAPSLIHPGQGGHQVGRPWQTPGRHGMGNPAPPKNLDQPVLEEPVLLKNRRRFFRLRAGRASLGWLSGCRRRRRFLTCGRGVCGRLGC